MKEMGIDCRTLRSVIHQSLTGKEKSTWNKKDISRIHGNAKSNRLEANSKTQT